MRQFRTRGIILNRTDYGEADRIITFLTPDNGKVKAIAKGVKKSKSKMAGGLELFSITDLSFIAGRSEINTVRSTRLIKHFENIVKDLDRTNLAYWLIQTIDKATEEKPEESYFELLSDGLSSADDEVDVDLIRLWFQAQLLKLSGHSPNLRTDQQENKLEAGKKYRFNLDKMNFEHSNNNDRAFNESHIKFLRLLSSNNRPSVLEKIEGIDKLVKSTQPLVQSMFQLYIKV
jgi:DNA repair protein RecO